ncbi:MAG: MerR family transcriptional regulator [Cyanobacteria bacterium REEB67]|nr:MerR family transcriptional regulator [Cyanobacteria bacterium REEB67]
MIVAKSYSLNIDELSEEIGRLLKVNNLVSQQQDNRVSPVPDMRTIRYYSGLGLVDRPAIMGRVAKYSGRHILQLLAIKVLQGASLPLAEIQSKLYGLSDNELENLISMYVADQAKLGSATSPASGHGLRPPHARGQSSAISWQEITAEPGLKIMAEQSWLDNLNRSIKQSGEPVDRAALYQKLTAALDALIGTEIESNGENI